MEIIKFLQQFSNPFLDNLSQGITIIGEETFFVVVLSIIFWCLNKKFGYKLGFALFISTTLNGAVKCSIKALRPFEIQAEGIFSLRVETATGYSFPSGHTQGVTTFFTSMMVRFKKAWVYILASMIILLVAASRLYLGVHWPRDVIAGIVFGVISVFISNYIFQYAEKNGNRLAFLWIMLPAIAGLFLIKDVNYSKIADYTKAVAVMLGFYGGYLVESKYINFNVQGELWMHAIKLILGIGGIVIIKVFVKEILPISQISDVFRYALIGFWATAGAPYLFIKLKLANRFQSSSRNIGIEL